jgi:hypothetical protein
MPPVEPSSAMRQMAHLLREMHVAMLREGFTFAEAMEITSNALSTIIKEAMDDQRRKQQGDGT